MLTYQYTNFFLLLTAFVLLVEYFIKCELVGTIKSNQINLIIVYKLFLCDLILILSYYIGVHIVVFLSSFIKLRVCIRLSFTM